MMGLDAEVSHIVKYSRAEKAKVYFTKASGNEPIDAP